MLSQKPEYIKKEKKDFDDLNHIVRALRSEEGCPWDREQTHESIQICMLEEAAETVDAISLLKSERNPEALREELGDVLFQVVLHSAMAEEAGYFTIDDVVSDISEKMIRRHPHVFGVYIKDENGKEIRDWNELKKWERSQKNYRESPRHRKWRKKLTYYFMKLLLLGKA